MAAMNAAADTALPSSSTPLPDTHLHATRLLRAYQLRQPIAADVAAGPASAEAAYAVHQAVWQAMAGEPRPRAWKVAAPDRTTPPMAAPVFPQRLAASPARFPGEGFLGLGIEAEIAFRFGRDLPPRATPYTRDEIRAAIASAHVAMELVDTRLADPEAAGPWWRLADNLLNGGLVIGTEIPHWRDLDLAGLGGLGVRIHANGHLLAESPGRPPLDDLFHCLPWWIQHIGGARAGDMVTTGAWTGMHPVGLPGAVRVEFVGLGSAEAEVG